MKKFLLNILAIALLCASFSSCQKDEFVFTTYSIGNIVNGLFLSDDGVVLNVVEQTCEGRLDTMKRAFIICDVLQQTKDAEKELDIRLKEIHSVAVKNVLKSDEIDQEAIGNDPVNMSNGWVTGGYLNILYDYTYLEGSETKHLVNLVIDKEKSDDSNLVLQLRHNGYGETLNKIDESSVNKIKVGHSYISFPLNDIIPSDRNQIPVSINWVWHTQIGTILEKPTIELSSDGLLVRPAATTN